MHFRGVRGDGGKVEKSGCGGKGGTEKGYGLGWGGGGEGKNR